MSDEIIKYIKNRKRLNVPQFNVGKILGYCGMEMYERLCSDRIVDEVGIDGENIIPDYIDGKLYLTCKGIRECEKVLLSYCNTDQMEQIMEAASTREKDVICVNNLLWFFRSKSIKELQALAEDADKEAPELHDRIRAEMRSRSIFNKVRLYFVEYYQHVSIRVKYRRIFRMIKDVSAECVNDSAYVPHTEPKYKKEIIHANYEKYRDISQQKRSRDEQIKYVFYGIVDSKNRESKYLVRGKECFEIESRFKEMKDIITAAAELTPRDFINMFPIDKEYCGEKYGQKDYFYTMKMLERFPKDEKIGDMIIPFLDIYYSRHVFHFLCTYVICIDDYAVYCGIKDPQKEYYNGVMNFMKQEVSA